jgi:amidase
MTSDLFYLDATDLVALIRASEVSAVEVLDAHLDRIRALNPVVNAVVSIDDQAARKAAAAADRKTVAKEFLGPLHGLPISFKDTARTAGMRTTHGSIRYAGNIPETNDLHVERILEAGAIPIGKTNVPEHAAGSHTVNRVFGATRNPYDHRMSVGGSSGGAAAALAAGFQPIADGSDMGGSLRNPASFCNVVGLRPTPGVVPNDGPNVFSPLTVTGPMARTVSDAALLLSVMAGRADQDPHSITDYDLVLNERQPTDLAKLRVAFAPTLGGRIPVSGEVLEVIGAQAALFESLGANVELACPDLGGAEEAFRIIRAAEFDAEWGQALKEQPEAFNPFLTWNIEEGAKLSARDVIRAQETITLLGRKAAEFFTQYDLVLAPAAQVVPFPVELQYPAEINGQPQHSYLDWMRAAYLFSPLGIPAISVPAGFTPSGLPVGLQMLSARGTDARLLRIAKSYENQSTTFRTPPNEGVAVL